MSILQNYLKNVGMRHDDIMEFWADLMNETKGQIAGWLSDIKITKLEQLTPYLRPNQNEH